MVQILMLNEGWITDIKQEPNLGKPLLFYPILKTQQIGVDSGGTLILPKLQ